MGKAAREADQKVSLVMKRSFGTGGWVTTSCVQERRESMMLQLKLDEIEDAAEDKRRAFEEMGSEPLPLCFCFAFKPISLSPSLKPRITRTHDLTQSVCRGPCRPRSQSQRNHQNLVSQIQHTHRPRCEKAHVGIALETRGNRRCFCGSESRRMSCCWASPRSVAAASTT